LAFDVFLSHHAKDKPRVRRLADRLQNAGLRVWYDDWSVAPGDIIALKVDEGLEQSRVLVLCISPEALASNWVALERSTAIHRDPANEGRRFIPLLLAECELPASLRRYKYVDFREETDAAFTELLGACGVQPANAPSTKTSASRRRLDSTGRFIKKPGASLAGHTASVFGVAISPDGQSAISASGDNTLRLWDLETGKCRRILRGHKGAVRGVVFTPDGKQAISCSGEQTMRIWSVESGECVATLTGVGAHCWRLAVSADGKTVVTCAGERDLGVWDLGSCLATAARSAP
jgi:hypothetical protein